MSNEYQEAIHPDLYDQTPKEVFAAIVVRQIVDSDARLSMDAAIVAEWELLHELGIVSQPPPSVPTVAPWDAIATV